MGCSSMAGIMSGSWAVLRGSHLKGHFLFMFRCYFQGGSFFLSGREGRFLVKKGTGNKNKTWNALIQQQNPSGILGSGEGLEPLYPDPTSMYQYSLQRTNLVPKSNVVNNKCTKPGVVHSQCYVPKTLYFFSIKHIIQIPASNVHLLCTHCRAVYFYVIDPY